MGIYIHNLKDPKVGKCSQGMNPFDMFKIGDRKLSEFVPCYNPDSIDAYNDIRNNIESWIEQALKQNIVNHNL